MRCALVGASDFNAQAFLSHSYDCVIAVDGGYGSLASLGVRPSIAVGDFDSLGFVPDVEGVEVLRFPACKDASDMDIALAEAERRGYDEMHLFGGLSGRLDHTLANIAVMVRFARRGSRVLAIGQESAVIVLDGEGVSSISFDGTARGVISAFSYGGTACDVVEKGLRYRLDHVDLPDDVSRGLSNEFAGEPCRITVGAGDLIIVVSSGAVASIIR